MYGELSDERIECLDSLPDNSRKSTHLIPGNTDNAEGLVAILCCDEGWLRRVYYR